MTKAGRRSGNIHAFATQGDTKGVLHELRKGTSVDVKDESGFTPLALAAKSSADSSIETMQLLIDHGANVNARLEKRKNSPLGLAACSGDIGKVKLLLRAGADSKVQFSNDYTVLINVAYKLSSSSVLLPMVQLLIEAGADIDAVSTYGESPLSAALHFARFDAIKYLLEAGSNPSPLGWTELLKVAAIGSIDELNVILSEGGELDPRDRGGRSAWHLAVLSGSLEKVKRLHQAGFDLEDRTRIGDTALSLAASQGNVEILSWLVAAGADIHAKDDANNTALISASASGRTECVELLLKAGADPTTINQFRDSAISLAENAETVRLLVAAGEDIADVSTEMKRRLLGLNENEELDIDEASAVAGCGRIFGRSNPELMEIPFWTAMVRAGVCAYRAQAAFPDAELVNPTWCVDRFGMSFTELPDGRFVRIGGEHEDFYDPNFCIYNDVFVHEPSGSFQIFGYPEDVFPPTDFHTATFVNGFIYIVGSLGYKGTRIFGTTPVYRLDCRTWSIQPVSTTGPMPGWIFDHKCKLEAGRYLVLSGGKICVDRNGNETHEDNHERFRLDLENMTWG